MINRRVVVIMPDTLLKAVDEVSQEYGSRSACIREALKYLLEKRLLDERRKRWPKGTGKWQD